MSAQRVCNHSHQVSLSLPSAGHKPVLSAGHSTALQVIKPSTAVDRKQQSTVGAGPPAADQKMGLSCRPPAGHLRQDQGRQQQQQQQQQPLQASAIYSHSAWHAGALQPELLTPGGAWLPALPLQTGSGRRLAVQDGPAALSLSAPSSRTMSPMSVSPRASRPSHAHTAFTEAAPSQPSSGVFCHQQWLAACLSCLPPRSTCCSAVHVTLMVRDSESAARS